MSNDKNTVRMTDEEILELRARGGDRSNWARVHAMTDEEVERKAESEDEPARARGWFRGVTFAEPHEAKQDVHIRLDPKVLRWFKSQGPGYQTRINTVLRAFVNAQEATDRK